LLTACRQLVDAATSNHTGPSSHFMEIEFVNLGFFSLRFHPLARPFEFVYSGYSQSRSAHPLSLLLFTYRLIRCLWQELFLVVLERIELSHWAYETHAGT